MERLIEPLPRGLNRLAAPLLVFIFGMFLPFDYVAAAGDGTIPHFEPEVGLFAWFCCWSHALLESVFLSWTDHHHHLTAFHFRELFHLPQFR